MTAAPGRIAEILRALSKVVHSIRREDEFADVHVATDGEDDNVVWLCEEWPTLERCELHVRSQQFARLLALVETSAAPPLLECRLISESRGLEYFAAVRGVDESTWQQNRRTDVEPPRPEAK